MILHSFDSFDIDFLQSTYKHFFVVEIFSFRIFDNFNEIRLSCYSVYFRSNLLQSELFTLIVAGLNILTHFSLPVQRTN